MHFVRLTFTSTHPISAGLPIPQVGTILDAVNDERTYIDVILADVELLAAPASAAMDNDQSQVRLTYTIDVETDDSTPGVGTAFDLRNDEHDFHGVLSKVTLVAEATSEVLASEDPLTNGMTREEKSSPTTIFLMVSRTKFYSLYSSAESVTAKLISMGLSADDTAKVVDDAINTHRGYWYNRAVAIYAVEVDMVDEEDENGE